MIHVHCKSCGHVESIPVKVSHRSIRCPGCRRVVPIEQHTVQQATRHDSGNRLDVLRAWFPLIASALLASFAVGDVLIYFLKRNDSRHEESLDARAVAAAEIAHDLRRPTNPSLKESDPASALVQHGDRAKAVELKTIDDPQSTMEMEVSQSMQQVSELTSPELPPPAIVVVEPRKRPSLESHRVERQNRIGDQLALAANDAEQIRLGRSLFQHEWKPHDELSPGGDGLGPLFNGRSCMECHFQAGCGGSGTNAHNVQSFEVLPDHEGGLVRDGVIHTFSTTDQRETASSLRSYLGFPKIPATEQRSTEPVLLDAVRTVFVNSPALWGDGLIEQITDRDLMDLEKSRLLTGRFRRLADGRIGKFGWKSQVASLKEFVASACAAELGLTNSFRRQQISFAEDPNTKTDMSDLQVASLVKFVGSLPVPHQVIPQDPSATEAVAAGHHLFTKVGCANCHVEDIAVAKGVYTDFRLHLVATASQVVDDKYYSPQFTPTYQPPPSYPKLAEWKTPPLWGLADTAPYWHDGSAPTIHEAILKHELEALPVNQKYRALSPQDQANLMAFLKTLKAPVFN